MAIRPFRRWCLTNYGANGRIAMVPRRASARDPILELFSPVDPIPEIPGRTQYCHNALRTLPLLSTSLPCSRCWARVTG